MRAAISTGISSMATSTPLPTLSIIMPAYNVEAYIAEAIDSVVSQTLPPHELLIVNDGSTDNTRDIIARYEHIDYVRVFDKENGGLGSARNHGLQNATGDYIYFFDSDDLLEGSFVSDMTSLILEHNRPDLVFFSATTFVEEGMDATHYSDYLRAPLGLLYQSDFPSRRLYLSGSYYASACMYVSRREIWISNGLSFLDIIHEDEELIFRLLTAAETVYVTPGVYFRRRVRSGSIMTSAKEMRHTEGCRTVVESLLAFRQLHGGKPFFDHEILRVRVRFFFNKYFLIGQQLHVPGLWSDALGLAIRARMPLLLLTMLVNALPSSLREGIARGYRSVRGLYHAGKARKHQGGSLEG